MWHQEADIATNVGIMSSWNCLVVIRRISLNEHTLDWRSDCFGVMLDVFSGVLDKKQVEAVPLI